ncbi:MAG: glycosyltransferase family 39 protein [Thermodesulfobacteriota bacterium]
MKGAGIIARRWSDAAVDISKNLSTFQWLLLLTAVGFSIRLYLLLAAVAISTDTFDYVQMAMGFKEGDWLEGLNWKRRPLYPVLLNLVYPVFHDYELAGRAISLFFGTLVIPLCFYLANLVYEERTGLYAAFMVTVHPYMMRYAAEPLTEGLYYSWWCCAASRPSLPGGRGG